MVGGVVVVLLEVVAVGGVGVVVEALAEVGEVDHSEAEVEEGEEVNSVCGCVGVWVCGCVVCACVCACVCMHLCMFVLVLCISLLCFMGLGSMCVHMYVYGTIGLRSLDIL